MLAGTLHTFQMQAAYEPLVPGEDCEAAVTSAAVFVRRIVRKSDGGDDNYFTPWLLVDATTGHALERSGPDMAPGEISRRQAAQYLL